MKTLKIELDDENFGELASQGYKLMNDEPITSEKGNEFIRGLQRMFGDDLEGIALMELGFGYDIYAKLR